MSASTAPTTFFREIDHNRRQSWLLVGVVVIVLGLLGGAIGYATGVGWVGVAIAVAIAVVLSLGSFFAGDQLVLASSGAKEIDVANPPDEYKQFVNVVTEMSIASGLPMPRVYVINDSAPNAFATGRDPQHASIAATTGLLAKLDREELQGVIGHEMSHIRNYDIRFTLLVAVLVGNRGGGGLQALIFVIAIILAIIAPIIARLVQLAVSRRREELADVSSVDLTRNPIGLAGALKAIADDPEVLEVANRATQHLYIVNPIKSFEERSKSMWDTHPPIPERIRILERIAGQMGLAFPPELDAVAKSGPG